MSSRPGPPRAKRMSSRATRFSGPCPVEPFNWGDTRSTSARLKADAAGIPQVDVAAVEREAFLKGYSQGEKAGGEAATARTGAMVQRLTESFDELATVRTELLRRSEQQTVQLALTIAQRLIQREISLDRTILVAMAHAALDRLAECVSATIRLHPDDYAAVVATLPTPNPDGHVQVTPDTTVGRGGCIVESDFGLMDVSHQAQLDELARAMLNEGGDVEPEHGHTS